MFLGLKDGSIFFRLEMEHFIIPWNNISHNHDKMHHTTSTTTNTTDCTCIYSMCSDRYVSLQDQFTVLLLPSDTSLFIYVYQNVYLVLLVNVTHSKGKEKLM